QMCSRRFTRERWWRSASSAALGNNPKSAAPSRSRKKTSQIEVGAIDLNRLDPHRRRAIGQGGSVNRPYLYSRCRFLRQLHCSLELRWFFFDSEVVRIELINLRHVIASQRRRVRRVGEFNELFFVVNVWQSRSHAIVCEQP